MVHIHKTNAQAASANMAHISDLRLCVSHDTWLVLYTHTRVLLVAQQVEGATCTWRCTAGTVTGDHLYTSSPTATP
jgi:hypothetical protein